MPGPEVRELYEATFPCGDIELWGWPGFEPDHRVSAPAFGPIHIRLPSAIDESTRIRLREEALEGRRYLAEPCSGSTGAGESNARSPLIDWCATRSPVLHDLHWNASIPRLIAEQTGAIVSPRGPGYIHYRTGDSVGVHRDTGYDLVLLTLLSGAIEPLHCHLHLADAPADEIEALVKATNRQPTGGTLFEINTVPFLLSGDRIPHHRAPQERTSDTVVLAQFYGLLLPLREQVPEHSHSQTRHSVRS